MTDTTNISKVSPTRQIKYSMLILIQAYAFIPLAWSSGATVNFISANAYTCSDLCFQLGPIIGGLLARPAERFPDLFGENTFLKKYPYFLPCAIPATFSVIAWLVTFFFLKETLAAPISIRRLFNITQERKKLTLQDAIGSTTVPGQNAKTVQNFVDDCPQAERPLPLRSLLIPRVLIAAGNYASLSLVDIAYRAIQPVFLSTPINLGGLGLPTPSIGTLLCGQGILNGIFQVFFFAKIHDRWGSKNTFIAGISAAIPVFVLFPVANALARTQGYSIAVWAVIALQAIAANTLGLSYGQCSLDDLTIYLFFF